MLEQPPDIPGLRVAWAISYLTPLREGGSLPAIIEADDGELYVMKFITNVDRTARNVNLLL